LFTQGEGWASDVWTKLAEQAFRLERAQWRLVPGELSALVPGAQRQSLRLETIEPRAVAELLREAGPQRIDCTQLTPAERDQVVRDIDDLDLLRQLVIHADRAGRLHAIDRHTFLESEFRVEDAFANLVTILRRSQSPAVLDKQRRLVDSWTERTAIRVALEQPQPHRFAVQILNALRGLGGIGELSADLRTRLKEACWLPGTLDRAFAPEYVLHIPGMDDKIDPLAAASEGVFAGVGALVPHRADSPRSR
jgi:hypothetical protein